MGMIVLLGDSKMCQHFGTLEKLSDMDTLEIKRLAHIWNQDNESSLLKKMDFRDMDISTLDIDMRGSIFQKRVHY